MRARQTRILLAIAIAIAVVVADPTDYGLADSVERALSQQDRQATPATLEPIDKDKHRLILERILQEAGLNENPDSTVITKEEEI